jgi:hypothetical protein
MINDDVDVDEELVESSAAAQIQNMRAIGYSAESSIADLLDNSIYAQAKNIWVSFNWTGADSFVTILDDGYGMNEDELKLAMRIGKNPLLDRESNDLGRFGYGLKTASFAQCKQLTVASKSHDGVIATRIWDVDHVTATDKWLLKRNPSSKNTALIDQKLGHADAIRTS